MIRVKQAFVCFYWFLVIQLGICAPTKALFCLSPHSPNAVTQRFCLCLEHQVNVCSTLFHWNHLTAMALVTIQAPSIPHEIDGFYRNKSIRHFHTILPRDKLFLLATLPSCDPLKALLQDPQMLLSQCECHFLMFMLCRGLGEKRQNYI